MTSVALPAGVDSLVAQTTAAFHIILAASDGTAIVCDVLVARGERAGHEVFEGKREGATGRKGRPDSGGAPARHDVKRGAPQGWTVFRMPTGWTVFETPSTPWLPDIRPI